MAAVYELEDELELSRAVIFHSLIINGGSLDRAKSYLLSQGIHIPFFYFNLLSKL